MRKKNKKTSYAFHSNKRKRFSTLVFSIYEKPSTWKVNMKIFRPEVGVNALPLSQEISGSAEKILALTYGYDIMQINVAK